MFLYVVGEHAIKMEEHIYCFLSDLCLKYNDIGVEESVLLNDFVQYGAFSTSDYILAKEELLQMKYIIQEEKDNVHTIFITELGELKFNEALKEKKDNPKNENVFSWEDEKRLRKYLIEKGDKEWDLIQKIDIVLFYLSLKSNLGRYLSYVDISTDIHVACRLNNNRNEIKLNEFSKIVGKLFKENHVNILHANMPEVIFFNNKFQITFDGLLWVEKGGYGGEISRNTQEERRIQEYHNLTIILAVGVSTPFLWNLLDVIRLYRKSWLDVSKIAALSVVSACVGAILWYILTLIERRKK